MAFRKYTQCYNHTVGDKPFNEDDLLSFAMGSGAGGLLLALIGGLALGNPMLASLGLGIAYAQILIAVANEWLYHRLACLTGKQCAIGTVTEDPHVGSLGDFDNDEFFNMVLMPHRPEDHDVTLPDLPTSDVQNDGFQGELLLKRRLMDLGFLTPADDKAYDRSLHCEAEGNFWVQMKEWAAAAGVVMTIATAVGGAIGAAIGCAVLAFLGPLGCLIGWLLGAAAAGAAVHFAFSAAAFASDPGDVEDANVGDQALGPIRAGDRVVVYGEHVYDGFHQGWHEIHPLMAVMKLHRPQDYLEMDPAFSDADTPPFGLTPPDMRQGLDSPAFTAVAKRLKKLWCSALDEAFDPATKKRQYHPHHRWTIHPIVDGCEPEEDPPVPH